MPPHHDNLESLGVLEMGNKRRPHLHQKVLQLFIRGTRNEYFVQRINDLLVVGDLVVNVRLIQHGAVEFLQCCEVLSLPAFRL